MTEKEAASMLTNMRLAAPEVDSALVELLSGWALRGLHASPEPKVDASLCNKSIRLEVAVQCDFADPCDERNKIQADILIHT